MPLLISTSVRVYAHPLSASAPRRTPYPYPPGSGRPRSASPPGRAPLPMNGQGCDTMRGFLRIFSLVQPRALPCKRRDLALCGRSHAEKHMPVVPICEPDRAQGICDLVPRRGSPRPAPSTRLSPSRALIGFWPCGPMAARAPIRCPALSAPTDRHRDTSHRRRWRTPASPWARTDLLPSLPPVRLISD